MTTLFDSLGGLRPIGRLAPIVVRRKVVRGRSADPEFSELETSYTRDPIYRAERRLNKKILTPYILSTVSEMQDYTNAVLLRVGDTYSRASWGVVIRKTQDTGLAVHQAGVIQAPGPIRQVTLLHEIAHHLVGSEQEHNPYWLDAFCFLLEQEMGVEIKQKLLDELA